MGWVFARVKSEMALAGKAISIGNSSLFRVDSCGIYLEIGGIPENCFCETRGDGESGWAVVGRGIRVAASHPHFMTHQEWRAAVAGMPDGRENIDGHYFALIWNRDRVECFTDQLGLRSAYLTETPTGVIISTRLDLAAQSSGKNEIDFKGLGSAWLAFNQIGYDSMVKGIRRLGPGGHASVRKNSIEFVTGCDWKPVSESVELDESISHLETVLVTPCGSALKPSLGLSGGLDSRLVLALLLKNGNDISTHTFGSRGDPDVELPRLIASRLGVEHVYLSDSPPDQHQGISLARSFISRTLVTEPVTALLRSRGVHNLGQREKLIVDGGFGEIARRKYLNRLVRSGKSALRARDAAGVAALMSYRRGDFFTREIQEQMRNGMLSSIDSALASMPPIDEIGIENFADLFSVRYRVPNQGGPEQGLFDESVPNFMPLVQPVFLKSVLAAPVGKRKKLYERLIRSAAPDLTKFPLASSGITYRFGLSGKMAWLHRKLKSTTNHVFIDPFPGQVLENFREFILDISHSKETAECGYYDASSIRDKTERYYRDDGNLRSEIDWWLTFELWRQSLRSPSR